MNSRLKSGYELGQSVEILEMFSDRQGINYTIVPYNVTAIEPTYMVTIVNKDGGGKTMEQTVLTKELRKVKNYKDEQIVAERAAAERAAAERAAAEKAETAAKAAAEIAAERAAAERATAEKAVKISATAKIPVDTLKELYITKDDATSHNICIKDKQVKNITFADDKYVSGKFMDGTLFFYKYYSDFNTCPVVGGNYKRKTKKHFKLKTKKRFTSKQKI